MLYIHTNVYHLVILWIGYHFILLHIYIYIYVYTHVYTCIRNLTKIHAIRPLLCHPHHPTPI